MRSPRPSLRLPSLARVAVMAASVAACSGPPSPVTAPAPADAAAVTAPAPTTALDEAPPIGERPAFQMPQVERWTMANGLEVWHVERTTMPLVTAALAVPHGSAADPRGKAGLAALTADLLDEGSGDLDALAFSEAIERLGSTLEVDAERDFSVIELQALARNLEPTLALMASAVRHPAMTRDDFARVKTLRLADLDQRRDEPSALARVVATEVWYGAEHPYAHPPEGHPDTVAAIELRDATAFHDRAWRPDGAVLVVVGDVSRPALEAALETQLGAWAASGESLAVVEPSGPTVTSPRLVVVPRPGAEQTVVRIVAPGAAVGDAEREAREALVNTLYGGSFTSRLMQNLREDKSWTYGAGSFFASLRGSGMFIQSASIEARHTGAALGEFRREMERLVAGDIAQDELDRALATLHADTVQTFETQRDTVDELLTQAIYAQPSTQPEDVLGAADALTLPEVNTFGRALASPQAVVYVLVGDPQLVSEQLEAEIAAGSLPAIELTSSDGTD